LFVNFHNAQPGRRQRKRGSNSWRRLWETLGIKKTRKESWSSFPHEVGKSLKSSFAEKSERRNYRVIWVGDFNDLNHHFPGRLTIPWSRKNQTLNLKRPLAKSCCSTGLGVHQKPKYPGDYIFDSEADAENVLPRLYNNDWPQSDHRPVEAILPPL